ncbi:Imm21 family immunity protein [Dactylosporangium sp. CS-033363]|uniref:Imm21 family immunity protein n=1 Tax=Dactylosporangium sp. CS-033363 TaxID=3239935 RepID=UPI003D9158E3
MRHLTRQFAIGALRRGNGIEQFLGHTDVDGEPAIRWVAISPMSGRYRVSLHTVRDPDDERVRDLANLISLDPVDEDYAGEGRELGVTGDEAEAMSLAERLTNAAPDRWVNFAVAGEEYADQVRNRRRVEHAWVGSAGGPLILVPESVRERWGGVPPTYPDEEGDYGRACAVEGYLGVIDVGGAPALVLAREARTTYLPRLGVLLLAIAVDEDADLEALVADVLPQAVWTESVTWPVAGPVVLFDSVHSGAEAVGEGRELPVTDDAATAMSLAERLTPATVSPGAGGR